MSSIFTQSQVGSKSSQNAIFINQDRDVGYIIDSMALHQTRHLLVTDDKLELTGVLSIMDVLKVMHETGGVDFLNIKAEDIMTKNVYTIKFEDTVRNAVLLLESLNVSGLPVMTDENISGYFTTKDVVSVVMNDVWDEIPDLAMSFDTDEIGQKLREEHVITDDYTVWQASDALIQAELRHLVVKNGSNEKYLGLLNPSILTSTMIPSFERKFQKNILQDTPLSSFEIKYNTFTSLSSSLQRIRYEMAEHEISCLPLIANQKIAKLVTEYDMVSYMSKHI